MYSMVNLEKKTIKKAGFGSALFLAGALLVNSVISPEVESYKKISDELSSMSAGERQYAVSQKIADFKASTFYQRLGKMDERLACDPYYERRASFAGH